MPNFDGLRGFVSIYAGISLLLYTWSYLESFYSGDNIDKKIAVKEGLLYLRLLVWNQWKQLTVGPGVSDTEFLSENLGFWPNLVQMVSISLKVTTIQIEPQMVPLGATRGRSFFYYMKIEGSKPAIYE